MKKRVVITGIGPVTGIGIGKDSFYENIMGMNASIEKIPDSYCSKYDFKSRHMVKAPELSMTEYGVSPAFESIMEDIAKFSVVGAKLALCDAGFKVEQDKRNFIIEGLEDAAVILGVGMSSLQTALQSYLSHLFSFDKRAMEIIDSGAKYSRMAIPMMMPNSASAWVSILFGLKGMNYTLNASCASGTFAIGDAYLKIADGYCDTAITGGVECLREKYGAVMRGFDMLTALTRSLDGRPMPFSKKRSGFLFNEGAGCILVLEELGGAQKRGAHIYAEICGYESSSDAHNIVQIEDSGDQIAKMLEKLKGDKKIDYFNAHGTGTIPNDEIEAKVIHRVFGDRKEQPLINSTKSIIGHSIGASGAIEAAVTALSIENSKVHGNITEDILDNLNLVSETVDATINYAISSSYGFGGHNGSILLKRYGE